MNGGRGRHSQFFVVDLGLALVAKTFPHRPQAFEMVNNGQQWSGVSIRKDICFHFIFLNEPIAGTPRHVCKKFHANIRRSDCVVAKINQVVCNAQS